MFHTRNNSKHPPFSPSERKRATLSRLAPTQSARQGASITRARVNDAGWRCGRRVVRNGIRLCARIPCRTELRQLNRIGARGCDAPNGTGRAALLEPDRSRSGNAERGRSASSRVSLERETARPRGPALRSETARPFRLGAESSTRLDLRLNRMNPAGTFDPAP